jgi:ABC-2 type transport system permease protein
VFLGAAVTAGADEQVIPFFEHDLSAEYELTRAVRVVTRTARKRIGIVDTDAKMLGGVDYERGGETRPPWQIVDELRKQYDVVPITPFDPIKEKLDALLVVLPHTLTQDELDNVMDAIEKGTPALVIDDPLPSVDAELAPAAPMAASVNPYASEPAPSRKQTGNVLKAFESIGVSWPITRIAWDGYRPHPELADSPPELVFVAAGSGNAHAFNETDPATSGLQEMVLPYPGYLAASGASAFTFEPLLETGPVAGNEGYFDLVRPSPAGMMVLNASLPHDPQHTPLTLAAHVRSTPGNGHVNAIVVADLDFISDAAFAMRPGASSEIGLDNVTFFLDCIDDLAGDDAFVALRKHRVQYRTLERVEAQERAFTERRNREEQQAAKDAQAAIDHAQENLKRLVADVDKRTDLDPQAKQIVARNIQETETKKLEALRAGIEQARDAKVQASRETMEADVRRIQDAIRTMAVLLPPLPVFLVGIGVALRRRRRERDAARSVGRLRSVV